MLIASGGRGLLLDFGYRVSSQRSASLSLNIGVCLEKPESLLGFGFKEKEKVEKCLRSGRLVLLCGCDPCVSLPSFPSGPARPCSTQIWRPATRSRQTSSRRRVWTRCAILTRTTAVRRPAPNCLHLYGFQRIKSTFVHQLEGNTTKLIYLYSYMSRGKTRNQ